MIFYMFQCHSPSFNIYISTNILWRYIYSLRWYRLSLLCSSLALESHQRAFNIYISTNATFKAVKAFSITRLKILQSILITQFPSLLHNFRFLLQQHPTLQYQNLCWFLVAAVTSSCCKFGILIEIYSFIVLEAKY